MKVLRLARPLAAFALVFALGAAALADTIRMKDGQVIRGQIVAFRDQQFTVLIGSSRGGSRRSRMTLNMEDVESIEFDGAGESAEGSTITDTYTPPSESARTTQPAPTPTPRREEPRQNSSGQRPPTLGNDSGTSPNGTSRNTPTNTPAASPTPSRGGDSPFFPVRIRVRADNAANGWTDSGLMVRKGQRLRITATGRVSLGEGRFSTPTGLPRVVDTEKLMRNEPTGELIAVIGDDNDEFIAVGANREFYATRDGRLFLGVNEGKLEDNTGSYDALIEVEPVSSGGR
ncbi:MAG: hypothetical protein JOZ96_23155 [Acidobacteria bacterium]|nr:hypothetical protein [Acidobacteriota bacterium]